MNINVTFRHVEATDSIKAYVHDKVSKLQRLLRQPMTAKVTLSVETHEQSVEVRLSSGGEHHEAKDVSGDMYASIDKVASKLERQINGAKGALNSKRRRSGETLRGGMAIEAE